MVGCKCSWLSKFLRILLHFGTNLAARIDGTTIGGVAGGYITYHGCNKKTPHGQACDHKQALSGDSPASYKKTFAKKKEARTCCRFVCTLRYSLSLTILRMRGMRCTRTWELHQLHTWYLQLAEYTWRYRHHTLGFWCRKTQKSKCGGDQWVPATGSFRTKDGVSFALLKRKEKKGKNKKKRKNMSEKIKKYI